MAISLAEAFERGRTDHQFFSQFFLNRTLHDTQLEFAENANATVNVLACSNRWGKTALLPHIHFHANIYKSGAEPKFVNPDGTINQAAFIETKYETVHVAGEWELASLTWDECLKIINESTNLQALIKDAPRSKPPHIDLFHGARLKFRTLGHNAEGVDGKSIYVLTIDEGGWIDNLADMMDNVLRVRVADVRGRIIVVGTFKPGYGRDFYKLAVRASAYTGRGIGFDHREDIESDLRIGGVHPTVLRYLSEYGVDVQQLLAIKEEMDVPLRTV